MTDKEETKNNCVVISQWAHPDYRPLLDEDLKELYKDTTHYTWEPLVAQAIRSMERLTKALEKEKTK